MPNNRVLTPIEDPTIAALATSLLARFAANVPDKTTLDEQLERALAGKQEARGLAAKMVQNFKDIPVEKRRAVFGNGGEVAFDRQSIEALATRTNNDRTWSELSTLGRRFVVPRTILREAPAAFGNDNEVFVPPLNPDQQFLLTYKGLYCKSETSWDGLTDSDEIYLTTTAISIDDQGNNVVRTEKHPITQDHYNDVDTGESRSGPVAAVWQGKEQTMSLIVHCREQDYGDPNKFKSEIETAVNAAVVAAQSSGLDPLSARFLSWVGTWAINYLLDTGDDNIDTNTHIFAGRDIWGTSTRSVEVLRVQRQVMRQVPWGFGSGHLELTTVTDDTHISQNFTMEHKGSGAHYISCYEMSKV